MHICVILATVDSLYIFFDGCYTNYLRRLSMTGTRTDFLETLRDSYSAYYDIHENESFTELPLVFRADYSSRNEKYWLTKNIKVWGNETNEYCYLFSSPSFDVETVNKCIDYAIADGQPRVKPHKEHQYTNFKTVFVADGFDDETIKVIKKRKFKDDLRMHDGK